MSLYPSRIVCLTEETTEWLYLLGAEDRIVGISGFTVRPARARKEKPKVSLFTDAKTDEIVALKPDLVLAFSDIQADIAAELARAGLNVMVFNQRSVAEIFRALRMLNGMLGLHEEGEAKVRELLDRVQGIQQRQAEGPCPRIYFEEWPDPMMSGIAWVSELIEIAGGQDIFDLRHAALAKDRIVSAEQVIEANPDIILGSWCGKQFKPEQVRAREGWEGIGAVKNDQLHEISSSIILQPGPAALTEGLDALVGIVNDWRKLR